MADEIPEDIQELGRTLGMSFALRLQALGSPAMQRVVESLRALRPADQLRESQNSGCQNGTCARSELDELMQLREAPGQ
jgi:hypothetical protein